MALAALPALIIVIPLHVFIDNVIIVKIIGTFVDVIIYVVVYSKIRKPIFKLVNFNNRRAIGQAFRPIRAWTAFIDSSIRFTRAFLAEYKSQAALFCALAKVIGDAENWSFFLEL